MKTNTDLVHPIKTIPYTDSLIIANEFKKPLGNIHRKIDIFLNSENEELRQFGLLNFEKTSYIDNSNREQFKYEITEDGFLEIVMSFTGDKARLIRTRFIKAFRKLAESYREPQRTVVLKDKRAAHNPMMDAIKELRADHDKEMRDDIYWTENKLCNFIVVHRFIGVCKIGGEDGLTNYEVELLAQVRKRNEAYILAGLDYKTRKEKLIQFGKKYREQHIDPSPRKPFLQLLEPCPTNLE